MIHHGQRYFSTTNPKPDVSEYIHYGDKSNNDFTNDIFDQEHAFSIENREAFWGEKAKAAAWFKEPT
jgi:hypothetical protein